MEVSFIKVGLVQLAKLEKFISSSDNIVVDHMANKIVTLCNATTDELVAINNKMKFDVRINIDEQRAENGPNKLPYYASKIIECMAGRES